MNTDVLVAGAGPTGLTLATTLRRWGATVRLVDAADGPAVGSRGFGVKPRTLEVLAELGIADELVAASRTTTRTRVHLGGALIADVSMGAGTPTPLHPFPDSVSLPQWRTEELLRTVAPPVEFGAAVTALEDDGTVVTAVLSTGEQVRARYVVGCDGGSSTVRKLLDIPFEGGTREDARALIADVDVDGPLDPDCAHIWLGDSDVVVLRPSLPGGPWQVVASLDAQEPSLELLQRLVTERTGLPLQVRDPRWMSAWRYNARLAQRHRVGRVFLAGDAAHVHSPFGAFGMNTGVKDAADLGWKLGLHLAGAAAPGLLDTYEAERRPAGAAAISASARSFTSATAPPRVLQPLLRHLVGPYLTKLHRRGRTDHPSYPDSTLSMQLGRAGRVRAGDAVGIPIGAPALTVLTFGEHDLGHLAGPFVQVRALDPGAPLGRALRARATTVAVLRPDGYLGLVARAADPVDVQAYLARVLHPIRLPAVAP